jgi:hypothetical protein
MAGYKRLPSQYASNLRRRIASDDGFQLLGSNKSAGYFGLNIVSQSII